MSFLGTGYLFTSIFDNNKKAGHISLAFVSDESFISVNIVYKISIASPTIIKSAT